MSSSQKSSQQKRLGDRKFCPLTAEKAKDWYIKKYISTPGYLLVIKEILRPPGVDLKIENVAQFCKEWKITRSAFYRGISTIAENNDGTWETTGSIILKTGSITTAYNPHSTSETDVPRAEQVSHAWDEKSHAWDEKSHAWDEKSHAWDEKSLKALPLKGSTALQTITDFIQTNTDIQDAPPEPGAPPTQDLCVVVGNEAKQKVNLLTRKVDPVQDVQIPEAEVCTHQPTTPDTTTPPIPQAIDFSETRKYSAVAAPISEPGQSSAIAEPSAPIPQQEEQPQQEEFHVSERSGRVASYSTATMPKHEQHLRRGKTLPPWRKSRDTGDYDDEFVAFCRARLNSSSFHNGSATIGDAKLSIQNAERGGNYERLELLWQEMKSAQQQKVAIATQPRHIAVIEEDETPSAAPFRLATGTRARSYR